MSHGGVVHSGVIHRRGSASDRGGRARFAASAHRHHQVVVREDAGGGGGPAQHQPAGAGLGVRGGLGAHQQDELVEGDRPEVREEAVADFAQTDDRGHQRRRRPGHIGPVGAEGARFGQPGDLDFEAVALASVAGHGDAEGAGGPAEQRAALRRVERRGRVEGDPGQPGRAGFRDLRAAGRRRLPGGSGGRRRGRDEECRRREGGRRGEERAEDQGRRTPAEAGGRRRRAGSRRVAAAAARGRTDGRPAGRGDRRTGEGADRHSPLS